MKTSKESEIDALLADALDDLYDESLVRSAIEEISEVKFKYYDSDIKVYAKRAEMHLNESLKKKKHDAKKRWIEKARGELRYRLDTMIRMYEESRGEPVE